MRIQLEWERHKGVGNRFVAHYGVYLCVVEQVYEEGWSATILSGYGKKVSAGLVASKTPIKAMKALEVKLYEFMEGIV